MDQTLATLLPDRPPLPPGPYSVTEYYRLARDGFLRPDDRVELIEGELVWMNAVGSRHASVVKRLLRCFAARIDDRALLSVQDPVRLDEGSEPEPDVALVVPRDDYYGASHPEPCDVLLIIEVADTSLALDSTRKRGLYATHGIVEYWVVDLSRCVVEVSRKPGADGYGWFKPFGVDGTIDISSLPGLAVPVREFVP